MHSRVLPVAVLATVLAAPAAAQGYRDFLSPSYRDFQVVRDRPSAYSTALTLRGGVAGVLAEDEDIAAGREDEIMPDGFVWFRSDRFTAQELGIDAYVGRDGAILSLQKHDITQGGGTARLELSSRFFPFYREGFYAGDDWVPTGRYEGSDYGAYFGLSQEVGEGARFEIGPFYRRYDFERSDATSAGYTIPEDYHAYGGRIYLEQNTLELDRESGLPIAGFIGTVRVEYERNDSDERFGTALWSTRLPTAFWRGLLHLEWLFPTEGTSVWELRLDGEINDDKDRVHIYDAQKPIGEYWADGTLGYRLALTSGLHVTPFVQLQYTKTPAENGLGAGDDFWFGGGARLRYDFGDSISLLGDYSYLTNHNRPTIAYDEDVYGEHQFFAGLEVRFGSRRF